MSSSLGELVPLWSQALVELPVRTYVSQVLPLASMWWKVAMFWPTETRLKSEVLSFSSIALKSGLKCLTRSLIKSPSWTMRSDSLKTSLPS